MSFSRRLALAGCLSSLLVGTAVVACSDREDLGNDDDGDSADSGSATTDGAPDSSVSNVDASTTDAAIPDASSDAPNTLTDAEASLPLETSTPITVSSVQVAAKGLEPFLAAVGDSSQTLAVGWTLLANKEVPRAAGWAASTSTDHGATWGSPVQSSLQGTLLDLAFDNEGVLYADTSQGNVQTYAVEIIDTTALTYTPAPIPSTVASLVRTGSGGLLAYLEGAPNLYSGSYPMVDGGGPGVTWSPVTPPNPSDGPFEGTLHTCPSTPGSPTYTFDGDGIYSTADDGATWTLALPLDPGSPGNPMRIESAYSPISDDYEVVTNCVATTGGLWSVADGSGSFTVYHLANGLITSATIADDDPPVDGSTGSNQIAAITIDSSGTLIVLYQHFNPVGVQSLRVRESRDQGATFAASLTIAQYDASSVEAAAFVQGDLVTIGATRYATYVASNGAIMVAQWTAP